MKRPSLPGSAEVCVDKTMSNKAIDPANEQERWDRVAACYADVTRKDGPTKYYTARHLLEVLPGTGRTLEMGCGDGYITDYLAQQCNSLTVLDGSKEQLEAIRRRLPHLTYVCSLFEAYAPPGPYDAIVAAHVLEHVLDPVSLLKRMAGWLAKGGRIDIVVPNAESLNRRLGVKMGLIGTTDELGVNDLAIGHRRIYTLRRLLEDIENAGLCVRNISGILIKPLSGAQICEWDKDILDGLYELGRELPPELSSELYVEAAVQQDAGPTTDTPE